MLYDILPFESRSKKGKKQNEKVKKKILIKKEDVNFQIQESGNLLKIDNHHFFQKENKKQLYLQQKILEKESKLKELYLLSAAVLFILAIVIFWIWRK